MQFRDFSQPLEGNYRIERDNGHSIVNAYWIKERIDECYTLRQQLAEREARVAELEATLYHGNLEREKCQKAMILRKQAEAADECLHLLKQPEGEFQMRNYADGLRTQADELEKAGGE